MARELMPKSGIMMPYVVVTRDAAVVGVSTVDGRAGALDLVSMGYAKAADYYKKTETYTKIEVDNLITPIMQRALFKDDPFINNNVALRSGGGNGIVSVDMIKVDPNNNIIVGDYDAGVQGVHIYSEGKVDVVYKDSNGQEKSAPLYSDRFRPPVADLPFAAIGQYVTDPTTGRTIGVNRTGENSDLKTLNALTNIKTTKVTFEQSPTVPDAAQPYDAVNLRQLQAAGSGGGATMSGVMNNFIGAVEWFNGSRAILPAGYIAADGQTLTRTDSKVKDLWAAVSSGLLASISEYDWINGISDQYGAHPGIHRGKYSTGDGSTNFRVPDLNGMQYGSISSPFLRGAGVGAGEVGRVYENGAPNITGKIRAGSDGTYGRIFLDETSGAFAHSGEDGVQFGPSSTSINGRFNTVDLNAAYSNAAYGRDGTVEVRPNSIVGIWIIRANGSFTAANTSYSVINSDTTLPAPGTVIEGGDIRSVYKVGDTEHMMAQLTIRRGVGQTPFARLWMTSADTGNQTVYDFPLNNQYNQINNAATRKVTSFNQINVPTPADVMLQNALDFRAIPSYAIPASYPMGVTSALMRGDQGWGRENQAIVGVLTSRNWPDSSGDNSCFQLGCNEQLGLAYRKPLYSSGASATYLTDAIVIRDTRNTTVDGNGFIKQSSPIVKIFSDGLYETNDQAKGAKVVRISEGVYKISGILGFSSDAIWGGADGGFELPINGNKLPLIWLDYEVESDGSIIIKTYHRTHPDAPSFAQNNKEGYKEADPIDIPKGRWVDLRVHMPDAK